MTDKERQEVNEFLVEHLFGIFICDKYEKCKKCKDTSKCLYGKAWNEVKSNPKNVEDYCTNAMPVLEKLGENALFYIQIARTSFGCGESKKFQVEICDDGNFEIKNNVIAFGNTIHEAVCRCAVEYLKIKGDL